MGRFDHITPGQRKVSNIEKQNQALGKWEPGATPARTPLSFSSPEKPNNALNAEPLQTRINYGIDDKLDQMGLPRGSMIREMSKPAQGAGTFGKLKANFDNSMNSVITGVPIGEGMNPVKGQTVAKLLGGLAGFIAGGKVVPNVGSGTFELGSKAVSKLPIGNTLVKSALSNAAGSVVNEGALALSNGQNFSPKDMAATAAENAAIDVLTHGAGKGLKKLNSVANEPFWNDLTNGIKAPEPTGVIPRPIDRQFSSNGPEKLSVDPEYVLGIGTKPLTNYDILKREGGFKSYEWYNNDVPRGQKAKLIESVQPGQTEIQTGGMGGYGGGQGIKNARPNPKEAGATGYLSPEIAATTEGNTARVLEPSPQPKLSQMGNLPGKNEPLGNGQKVRSFGVTTVDSPMTSPEVKAGVAEQIKPEGKGVYDPITLKGVDEEAQRLVNADPEKAAAMILNEKEPSALHTATGIRLIEHFQKQGHYERAVDVSMQLADRLTKAGQEISAARIMSSLSPEGILTFASRQIKKINEGKWFKKFSKDAEISPESAKQLDELARKLQETTDPAVKIELGQELQSVLHELTPSNWMRKLAATQTISQLLNPKTQVRNIIGNELFYRLERLNKYVATPIDFARSAITGKERTVTFRTGGQGGYWDGFFKGAKAGWKGVNVNGLATQYDLGHGPAFKVSGNIAEKTMAYLEKSLGAVMKGFDNAAYTRAYNQTLGEMATLRAINTAGKADKALIQKYMQESSDHLMNIADQYGKYVTFQDKNILSNGLSAVKRGMNLGKEFGAGDFILKYPKTPGAIIMRALDYSPAGFLRSAGELMKVKGWIKGIPNEREATLALSRAIVGTAGFTGMGMFLANKGLLVGSGTKDYDAQELQRQTGEGDYQVNISAIGRFIASGFNPESAKIQKGDNLVTYDWAQPIAMSLSMGANVEQSIKDHTGVDKGISNLSSTVVNGLEGSINTVAEQPVLQGVAKMFRSLGSGDVQGLGGAATTTLKGVPSSFMPTFGNQLRQSIDNTARSTYDPSWMREAGNKAKVKIPGLSKSFPVAYDTLGRPKENFQNGSNNLVNVFLNPSFVSKYDPTPEAKLALDLMKDTGETKQIPRIAPKNFTISGKKFELSPQEYSDLQRIVGEDTQSRLATITSGTKPVNEMSATEKDDLIKKMMDALDKAGKAGKEAILKGRGENYKSSGNGLKLTQ